MRTRFVTLASLVSLVAALTLAPAGLAGGVLERATGSGHRESGGENRTFAFNAVKQADGSVTGHILVVNRAQGTVARGDVQCLRVVGNTAYLSGVITKHTDPARVGFTFVTIVQDNGEGTNEPPDLITNNFGFPAGELSPTEGCLEEEICACLLEQLGPIENGNVQVQSLAARP